MNGKWEDAMLRDVCTFENGDRGKNYPSKKVLVDAGIPFVNAGNLENGKIDFPSLMFVTEERYELLSRGKFNEGDVLFCLRGSLGKFAIVEGINRGAIASSLVIVRPKEQLSTDFFLYYLESDCCHQMVEEFEGGAAQPNLSAKDLGLFEIPLPPLAEQKEIVAILDEAFSAIAKAKAAAEKNLANARELFESYLNRVFTQRGEGWVEKKLTDVVDKCCSLSYGIVQPGKDYPNGLPVVRPTDLKTTVVELIGLKKIDPKLAQAYRRTTLIGDELLLCVRGSTGVVSTASLALAGGNVTRGIVPIRFDESQIMQKFGYYVLVSNAFQSQIKEKTYGAALMQINIRDLRKVVVPVPPLTEQERMFAELQTINESTERLKTIYTQKLANLNELKQSLLQKAFTGQLTGKRVELEMAV